MGKPTCKKKGVKNICDVKNGNVVANVTAKADCPWKKKMHSFMADVTNTECETCVDKPDEVTTTEVPDANCAACDFASGKTWCWSVMKSPTCANSGVTNVCDQKDGKDVAAVTSKAKCPLKATGTPKCFGKDEAGSCAAGTYPKVESFGQCPKDANRAAEPAKACKECVEEPDPDCAKCDFPSGSTLVLESHG